MKEKFEFLKFKDIQLDSWSKNQLKIQADSLSGHLDEFWPDIKDSRWVGGDIDDWERMPYWLDGFIPLAYLLHDEKMEEKAKFYINAILSRQCEDGWLCPTDNRSYYDIWPLYLLTKVLVTFSEYSDDEALSKRCDDAVYRALKQFNDFINGTTIRNWAAARWYECFIAIKHTYDLTHEDWLLDLARKLRIQGFSFKQIVDDFTYTSHQDHWEYMNHVVNYAMAVKCFAMEYELLGNEEALEYTDRFLDLLDKYHGTVTGTFTGDENLSGKSPRQGTELCAVVDEMYSLELLVKITNEQKYIDRLEKIAFNCLPATFSPDMWTHQYDQQVNQINCVVEPKPIFSTNGPDSNLFGLEPNYGCCTSNLSQGWPKFFHYCVMKGEKKLVINTPVPMTVNTTVNKCPVALKIVGNYPFDDEFTVMVDTVNPDFELDVHVPNYVSDEGVRVFKITENHTELKFNFQKKITFVDCENSLTAILYGPLVFSLKLNEIWTQINLDKKGHEFPHCDYEVRNDGDWEYAICSKEVEIVKRDIGDMVFSPDTSPIELKVRCVKIDWGLDRSYCNEIPNSLTPIGETVVKTFIPFGCTDLRLTLMPIIKEQENSEL